MSSRTGLVTSGNGLRLGSSHTRCVGGEFKCVRLLELPSR